MRKIVFVLVALLVAASSAQAGKGKPKKVKMTNEIDTVSYSIGITVGNNIKNQVEMTLEKNYNADLMLIGIQTALKGDSTLISLLKADTIVDIYMKDAFKKKEDKRIEDNKNFLIENAKKPGVVSLPSGLQYSIIEEGKGARPADTSMVKVHYTGTLIDGTVFDSSYKRGEPASFRLNQVIKGWTEGVQLMSIGSKYKFVIPAEIAYGTQRMGPILPNSTLIFDVELLDIEITNEVEIEKKIELKQ